MLAVPPKLIIADEMSLGLAPLVVNAVFESIEQAAKNGVTIVLIEQFVHRALGLASECVILKQGSIAWTRPLGERAAKRCSTATSGNPPTQWRKATLGATCASHSPWVRLRRPSARQDGNVRCTDRFPGGHRR